MNKTLDELLASAPKLAMPSSYVSPIVEKTIDGYYNVIIPGYCHYKVLPRHLNSSIAEAKQSYRASTKRQGNIANWRPSRKRSF